MKRIVLGSGLALMVGLAACGQDASAPNGPTPLLNSDVVAVAADQVGEDVDIMREPVFFIDLPFGAGPVLSPDQGPGNGHFTPPGACTYNSTTQRLECPTTTRGSLTVTRSYAFWDANGVAQSQYDPETTATANIQTGVEGSRSNDHWSGTVDRFRDMTATGLAGAETQRTWNGTGTSSITRSRHTDEGEERSYDLDCTTTVDDVVVPVPRSDEHFPLSGSITLHCVVSFEGGPRDGQTAERTVTITFNGTATATATVGDKTFDIDLKQRNHHRRP